MATSAPFNLLTLPHISKKKEKKISKLETSSKELESILLNHSNE